MAKNKEDFSTLCQLKGGCMGCCGHDFGSVKQIRKAVMKNTREFHVMNPKERIDFVAFRERYDKSNLLSGVCRNLISKEGCMLCPLHPSLHTFKEESKDESSKENLEDLRKGHCNIHYLCPTAKAFALWDEEKKKQFVEFIEGKEINNIEYSLAMDKGELLEEFLKGF